MTPKFKVNQKVVFEAKFNGPDSRYEKRPGFIMKVQPTYTISIDGTYYFGITEDYISLDEPSKAAVKMCIYELETLAKEAETINDRERILRRIAELQESIRG